MGIMVYFLFWVMQDFCHQPYLHCFAMCYVISYNIVQYYTVLCYIIQFCTLLYGVMSYHAMLHCVML